MLAFTFPQWSGAAFASSRAPSDYKDSLKEFYVPTTADFQETSNMISHICCSNEIILILNLKCKRN